MFTLPNHSIKVLSIGCSVLLAAYVALVATTILYANSRTLTGNQVRTLESSVASLETEYYSAIAKISNANIAQEGFATPRSVRYVSELSVPAFSFAGSAAPTVATTHRAD